MIDDLEAFDLAGHAVIHTAPNVHRVPVSAEAPVGYAPFCIGTTTSMRMERFTDALMRREGVRLIVGKGGMGVVMEATNVQLDQKVALKLLARNADDPAVVERFMREAKAAARLKSEHVARVFDVGKDPAHGPYIVMEMLDGSTLAEVLLLLALEVRRCEEVDGVVASATGRGPPHRFGQHLHLIRRRVWPASR